MNADLPFSASESRLLKEFSKYGQIAEGRFGCICSSNKLYIICLWLFYLCQLAVRLITDKARQKSKGFAFIQYTSQEAALLALESMDYQVAYHTVDLANWQKQLIKNLFIYSFFFSVVWRETSIRWTCETSEKWFWWISKNLRTPSRTKLDNSRWCWWVIELAVYLHFTRILTSFSFRNKWIFCV